MLRTESECIEYIHSAGRFGKKAGLCNIKALLDILGNPQRELKCIHIAGTNGKGSVSCMLRNILTECGYKVGMNTSPFIEVFNERLTIDGVNIPPHKLIYYTNLVADAIRMLDNVHPIEFEIITAIGFLYFRDEDCDYAVIECGLGGLYDSTNVIEKPVLNVITRIGLDHTEILGSTIEEIAFQKAGTIKENSIVVLHPDIDASSLNVIRRVARGKNAQIYETKDVCEIVSSSLSGTHIRTNGTDICLKLLGSYQASNASLAVNCARHMGIEDSVIKKGIENSTWKCRFELIGDRTIIDGAHNFQGVCAFIDSAYMYLSGRKKVFVIGMLNDKDFSASARALSKLGGDFIITDVPSTRQTNGKGVYEEICKYIPGSVYESDYKRALDLAYEKAGSDGFICVAGSLYLAGAVRTYVKDKI